MRGRTSYSMPRSVRYCFTASKCTRQASQSESRIDGSASITGWSASTLQSSTRKGLVSARRWQSPHIWGALSSNSSRSFSTYCGRQF